jgi:hypothetical protein
MTDPTSPMEYESVPKSFAPKTPVDLAPPKSDPITYEELAKCDGASAYPKTAPFGAMVMRLEPLFRNRPL